MEKDVHMHQSIIWYEFKRGQRPSQILQKMKEVLGNDCPCEKTIYNWYQKFRDWWASIYGSDCSDCPNSSVTADSIVLVPRTIEDDSYLPIRSIAELTGSTSCAVQTIHTNQLDTRRCVATRVSKLLNSQQLKARNDVCCELSLA
jgi:hypothetical protein